MSSTITLTFDLSIFITFAFLGFLTILGTKFVCGLLMFVLKPKLDGISLFAFAAVLQNLQERWFVSLLWAIVVGLLSTLLGWSMATALLICAIPAALIALFTGLRMG